MFKKKYFIKKEKTLNIIIHFLKDFYQKTNHPSTKDLVYIFPQKRKNEKFELKRYVFFVNAKMNNSKNQLSNLDQ